MYLPVGRREGVAEAVEGLRGGWLTGGGCVAWERWHGWAVSPQRGGETRRTP